MFRILTWKQLAAWLTAVVLVVACFTVAVCSVSAGTDYGDRTVLTLCHWDNGGATETNLVKEVCAAFEQTYNREIDEKNAALEEGEEPLKKIKINVSVISSYETQFNSIIASRNVPDVFLVPDGNFGQWVQTGVMLELTDYIERSELIDLEKVWPSAIDRYRYNGRTMGSGSVYCMPKDVTPYVMYYNKDMFDEYGVPYPDGGTPWTPEEALEDWSMFGYSRPESMGGAPFTFLPRRGKRRYAMGTYTAWRKFIPRVLSGPTAPTIFRRTGRMCSSTRPNLSRYTTIFRPPRWITA